MIGSFLEISVATPDISESLRFYERLGFSQAPVGEIWPHHYAVVTDGRMFVGLHDADFYSPSLTFVRPELEDYVLLFSKHGVEMEFCKTGEEQFNEAGFFDPDLHMVKVVEARTYSPPILRSDPESLLGNFAQYTMPTRDAASAVTFWEPMGFVLISEGEDPFNWATLTSDLLNLSFYETTELKRPALTFIEPDMEIRLANLEYQNFEVDRRIPGREPSAENGMLRSPEGLDILMLCGQH